MTAEVVAATRPTVYLLDQEMSDDLCAVVKTDDLAQAMPAVLAHMAAEYAWTDKDAAYAAEHLSTGRLLWYRWNPCDPRWCEEGPHTGHLGEGKPGQRGAWLGVAVYR